MELPEELVLIIAKFAGHATYESAVKCCKNWRTWIKRDTIKNFKDWKEIFDSAMKWNDEHNCETLPGGVLHNTVFKVNYEYGWVSWTNYHRGLRHGKMIIKHSEGMLKKETVWLWDKGNILSSRTYTYHAFEGMGVLRYSN
ncbi:hypothetical protein BNJ_00162 [Kaumoebavirus]|uniref:hypothetical protein n=1 Tax=Kaumoebavirus TaxID=1859492 RepID=UPI0009C1C2B1|nr:hypothetical protein BNJ_00162 [Kaumoebavirus]ARA71994.1 hypothetical protein BNJ_00162 [Kaumoebavirus]